MQFKLLSRHKENIFQTKLIWEVRHSEASSNPRQLDVLWLSRWIMQQGDHFSSTFSSEREEETMMFEARRSSDFTKRDPACDTVPKGQRVWAKPRGGGGGGPLPVLPCVTVGSTHPPSPWLEFFCTPALLLFRWHFSQQCLTMSDAVKPCSFTPCGWPITFHGSPLTCELTVWFIVRCYDLWVSSQNN